MKIRITALLVCALSLALAAAIFDASGHGKMKAMKGMPDDHFAMVWNMFDANKDGKISMDEWHGGWKAILKQADTDNDGTVSKDEAKAYADSIKKPALDAAAAKFAQMDKDKDGDLEMIEWRNAAAFKAADANKDGKVSKDEFLAYHEKMMNQGAATHDMSANFAKIDTDNDGTISSDEIEAWAHALFTAYDKNKDNSLSKDELKAGMVGDAWHSGGKGKGKGKPTAPPPSGSQGSGY